jgi:transposase
MRELKGLEIAARLRVVYKAGHWVVPSQSGKGPYQVCLQPGAVSCTCEDHQLTGQPCKHIHAARLVQERDHGGLTPAMDTEKLPKRPTYRQNWSAYNLAQTTEKKRFQALLFDLLKGVPKPAYPGRGRPRVLVADAIFAMAFKVYSTFSTRRFACDLQDAHERGYLARPMHYNVVCNSFEDVAFTPMLKDLIVQSSLPLRTVETTFAPDSTGFSTSRFVRWYDEKYGVHRSGHDWVKAHAICGVKTNIVTAVEILDRDAGDSPQFKPLVEKTAENFAVKEVTADKAYLSRENLAVVDGLGGAPFIPFKANSLPGDGLWAKMYGYYQYRREDFLSHYHLRSNAESTFSMVKAKFRDHVRAKTPVAMVNEVLLKFICHNICCVIQSQCELGIEAVFWDQEPLERPDVLPMNRPG